MANSLAAALKYLNGKLDKAYKAGAKTSAMDVNPAFVREADVAGTFYLPKLSMPGLGNVVGGVFPAGAVTQTWDAYTYVYDRGRKIEIEKVSNDEAAMVAIANAASEYMRLYVIPEIDAIRFAKIAAGAAAGNVVNAAISTSAEAIAATNAALVALANAEVDAENLLFFASPDLLDLLDNAASTEKKARILSRTTPIEVPQGRFVSGVTLDAGSSDSAGGFTKAADAFDLNFVLMDKNAAFADAKHIAERLFSPEVNQGGDAWRWDYRIVHDAWVYANKTAGIYVHGEVAPS